MSEIRQLIEEGLTLSEIAKKKGVSRQIVSRWAKAEGIDYQAVIRQKEMIKVKVITDLALAGLTRSEIARQLPDIPFNSICSLIRKYKIQVKKDD